MEGGTEVSLPLFYEVGVLGELVSEGVEEGGLQSTEAVVVAGDIRLAEGEGLRVALVGEAVHHRPARIAKPHDFSALVEGLTRCIIDRLTDDLHVGG